MKLNVTNPKNFSQPGQSSRKVKEQGLDPDLQSKHVYLGGKAGVSDSEEKGKFNQILSYIRQMKSYVSPRSECILVMYFLFFHSPKKCCYKC